VGFGIFKSEEPEAMAVAIVQAVHNFDNGQLFAERLFDINWQTLYPLKE
jgi:pyridoxal biosynthesis lyase PdxS